MGNATVVTNLGKAMLADRLRSVPTTYTISPKFVAMGTGATAVSRTAATGDVALTNEVGSRTLGTESIVSTTVTGDTYQVVGTVTATTALVVDEFGLFDHAIGPSMAFSATFTANTITLANGDVVTFTARIQLS